MSKITRAPQKIFGSSAVAGQIKQIGSLAAGSPLTTTDPTTIQALTNYLTGWFGVVLGSNSPAIEDMNALCYLFAYQLAYGFQAGIAEWEAATTYYTGSFAQNGNGVPYVSAIDTNLNQAVTDRTKWLPANPAYDVVVGAGVGCTHATLAAALADASLTTNITVLLKDSATLAATITMTKAGWKIKARPGVTYTAGVATTAISVSAANCTIEGVRFSGFTTGVSLLSGGNYARILNCNFATTTTDVDVSGVTGALGPVITGSIDE